MAHGNVKVPASQRAAPGWAKAASRHPKAPWPRATSCGWLLAPPLLDGRKAPWTDRG